MKHLLWPVGAHVQISNLDVEDLTIEKTAGEKDQISPIFGGTLKN